MTREGSAVESSLLRHRVMVGCIGNLVEWYDFAVCGYLAATAFIASGSCG